MYEVDFCVKFKYDGDRIPSEIRKELDDFVKLMVKTDPSIFNYDLRGCI